MPGLAVGASLNGEVVMQEGYGFADVEQLVPCTRHTTMRIASISKSITAVIAARLVQNRAIDLDTSIKVIYS